MVAQILCGLAQFIDHQIRRPIHRIAHSQVNNIDILTPFFEFQRVESAEQIRRQTLDPLMKVLCKIRSFFPVDYQFL